MRGLGTSRHQIAIKRAFIPFCGISFQEFQLSFSEQRQDLRDTVHVRAPNWEADTWSPLMEAHPLEFSAVLLEALFPIHGSTFSHLRYLGQDDKEAQETEGTGATGAASSATEPCAPAASTPTKTANPENLAKEEILQPRRCIMPCLLSPTWSDPCAN